MLLAVVIGTWAMLIAAKGTPIGAAMRRWLVEKPAARLSHIHRQTVLAALALVLAGLTAAWVIGPEGVLLYSMALPELTAALAMIDLGVMVDVAMMLVIATTSGGWRALRTTLAARLGRARSPRARRPWRAQRPAANDDGEAPGFALAA